LGVVEVDVEFLHELPDLFSRLATQDVDVQACRKSLGDRAGEHHGPHHLIGGSALERRHDRADHRHAEGIYRRAVKRYSRDVVRHFVTDNRIRRIRLCHRPLPELRHLVIAISFVP